MHREPFRLNQHNLTAVEMNNETNYYAVLALFTMIKF